MMAAVAIPLHSTSGLMRTLLLLGHHGALVFASIKVLEHLHQFNDTSREPVGGTIQHILSEQHTSCVWKHTTQPSAHHASAVGHYYPFKDEQSNLSSKEILAQSTAPPSAHSPREPAHLPASQNNPAQGLGHSQQHPAALVVVLRTAISQTSKPKHYYSSLLKLRSYCTSRLQHKHTVNKALNLRVKTNYAGRLT